MRSDFFLDACAIEDVVEDGVDSWKEWTPVCTDGEMAAFIELASGGKVYILSVYSLNFWTLINPWYRNRLNFILTSQMPLLTDKGWTGTAKKLVSMNKLSTSSFSLVK